MFISGMITHGAFMLTLDLLFSFVLSSVCFHSFLFSLYIRLYRISHIMYIILCFPFLCCTKRQMCPLGYFLSICTKKNVSLFCFQWTTHTTPNHWRQFKNCSAFLFLRNEMNRNPDPHSKDLFRIFCAFFIIWEILFSIMYCFLSFLSVGTMSKVLDL